ncbi:pilus assembly protein PilO [Geobacillus stearothermophilus]|uniref:pilus assembly protein PilO n=1 Tax=Geobacillus stearothermophilus TaxID=1422 RepID=UPI00066FF85B|nr:pilus assembly protein PilO [Geobacillus stearothermophilus]KMY63988.1 pilus assembly protein PilO [Geobacillus stearothermophilus]KMY64356.1 pilus assembly protein PilO [Geobacillus stearothermophilus]
MSRFGKWPLLAAAMALVIMLLFAAAYAWLVMPRYSQLEQMEQTVQSEKKVLAALKQKLSLSPEKTAETVAALQKKVPVHPLTDQLLLLFQKAEYVADSRLVSVQFSDEGAASSQQNGNGTNNGGEGTQAASPPSSIQSVTAQLTVQSPSYYQLERFLEVLEQAERIVAIEGLTVTGPPKLTSTNDDVQPLTYSVTVRAFYAPKLEKWKAIPSILDVPPPSGKDNPFAATMPAS